MIQDNGKPFIEVSSYIAIITESFDTFRTMVLTHQAVNVRNASRCSVMIARLARCFNKKIAGFQMLSYWNVFL